MASEKDIAAGLPVPGDYETPPGWGPVAVYESAHHAHEVGLFILAMGYAYWLLPHEERFVLCVDEERLPAVQRELDAVRQLGNYPVTHLVDILYVEQKFSVWSFVIYAALLCGYFVAQSFAPIADSGRVDAGLMVEEGEWWRAVTALTLHADVIHLVSNLVAGVGFALLVARLFGAGLAWLLILLTGAAGNALNACVHYPEMHFSIGASTAVFGALGLITGAGLWLSLMQPAERWALPRWLLPAFGGLTLLGLLGVGDGVDTRIDVAAHISGFMCGCLLGFVCAMQQKRFVRSVRFGKWVGVLTLALLGMAWLLALL